MPLNKWLSEGADRCKDRRGNITSVPLNVRTWFPLFYPLVRQVMLSTSCRPLRTSLPYALKLLTNRGRIECHSTPPSKSSTGNNLYVCSLKHLFYCCYYFLLNVQIMKIAPNVKTVLFLSSRNSPYNQHPFAMWFRNTFEALKSQET